MEGSRIVFPILEKRSREIPSFFGNDRKTMPRIVFPAVGKTTGMQSEPRRPEIILSYIGGHVVKRAPKVTIPPCGPAVPACLPEDLGTRRPWERSIEMLLSTSRGSPSWQGSFWPSIPGFSLRYYDLRGCRRRDRRPQCLPTKDRPGLLARRN